MNSNNLESSVKKMIGSKQKSLESDGTLKRFEESSSLFEELVKRGLIKRRGNRSLSSSEKPLANSSFNATP